MKSAKLSDRQLEILRFTAQFIEQHSIPPTIREIGEGALISSTSVVTYNLNHLEDQKLLQRKRGVSRGISLNWNQLETRGLNQMLRSEDEVAASTGEMVQQGQVPVQQPEYHFYSVPLLGRIAAGIPINVTPADRENPEDWVEFRSSRFRQPEELFALRVQGDSMIDASVMDGDIVILRQQQTAENGEIVAAWVDDMEETTLKRIYALGNVVELRPCNPLYKSIYPRADQVTISGKLVSVLREYE